MTDTLNPPVLVRREGALGRLTLNRPEALHALTQPMCTLMLGALRQWAGDEAIGAVLIDHAGPRGFCAGGDIRMLAESGAGDGRAARAFFAEEYRLNTAIHRFPKPYIALMDGVTMGGGVGASVHGRIRIATDRTTLAMPETGIGLFPDVGGGWFLPRLPGRVGVWMALTGARLKAADCLAAGVADVFVPSDRLEGLKAALVEVPAMDAEPAVRAIVQRFAADPGPPKLLAQRGEIDRLFAGATVDAIAAALEADPGAFAQETLTGLKAKSPQTLKVALRQIQEGGAMQRFEDVMAMEYRIACRVVHRHDFLEGVRAVIVEKDNAPRWSPATIEGVSEAMLDEIFAPLPAGEEWRPA